MLQPLFRPSKNVWVIKENKPVILKVEIVIWEQYQIGYMLSGYNFGKTKIEVVFKQVEGEMLLMFITEKEAQNYIDNQPF